MPTQIEPDAGPVSLGEQSEAPKRKPWTPPRLDRSGDGLLDEVRQTKYTSQEGSAGQSLATTS